MRGGVLALGVLLGVFFVGGGAQEELVGGGGSMALFFFADLAPLNEVLVAHGFAGFSSPVLLWGGGGLAGGLRDIRIGGFGFGGDVYSVSGEKVARLALGFGGMVFERGIWSGNQIGLSFGALLGGGSAELELVHRLPSSFADALESPVGVLFSRSFFLLQPYLGVEFYLFDWLFVKVQLGYTLTLGWAWEMAGRPVEGPPLNLNAPVLQVFLGFGGRVPLEEGG